MSADHVPGHDEGDPTFPMPIPGQDFFRIEVEGTDPVDVLDLLEVLANWGACP